MKITVGYVTSFTLIIYSHISPSFPPYLLQHGYVILYFSPINSFQFTNFFIHFSYLFTTAGLKVRLTIFTLFLKLTLFSSSLLKSSVDGWWSDLLGEYSKQRYLFTISIFHFLYFQWQITHSKTISSTARMD